MKNRIITLHKWRSALFVGHLKESTGLTNSQVEEKVRATYRRRKMLGIAPTRETVMSMLNGKRNIPFDPPGRRALSWLMAAEETFPGCSRYFFHPMINLLIGPIQSSGKWEASFLRWPREWVEKARLKGDEWVLREAEKAEKSPRRKSKVESEISRIEWIHTNIFRLEEVVRDVLMERQNNSNMWARKYGDPDREAKKLIKLSTFESLTGSLAMWLEAQVIHDWRRMRIARTAIEELLPVMDKEPSLKKVKKDVLSRIKELLEVTDFKFYDENSMKLSAYPITWRMLAQHLIS